MSKKSQKVKVPIRVKDDPAKLVFITDTTYLGLGKTSSEGIYNLLKAKDPTEIEEGGGTTDSSDKSENTLKDLVSCFLHKIVARAKLLP